MRKTRYRYVAFRIAGEPVDKGTVIRWLNELSRTEGFEELERLRLVHFEANLGLVRCVHKKKERIIGLFNGTRTIGGRVLTLRTLGTSGTIRAALSKYVNVQL